MSEVTIGTDKTALSAIGMNDGSLAMVYSTTATDASPSPNTTEGGKLVLRQHDFFGTFKKEIVLEDFLGEELYTSGLVSSLTDAGISWADMLILNDGRLLVVYSIFAKANLATPPPPGNKALTATLRAKILSPALKLLSTTDITSDLYVSDDNGGYSFETYGRFKVAQLTGGNIVIPYSTIDITTNGTNDTVKYRVYNNDLTSIVKADATLLNPAGGRMECHAFSGGTGVLLYSKQDITDPVFPRLSYINSAGTITQTIAAVSSNLEGFNSTGERGPAGSITANGTILIITNDTDSALEVTTFVEYDSGGNKITGPTVMNGLTFGIFMAFPILTLLDNDDLAITYSDHRSSLNLNYILMNKVGSTWQWTEQLQVGAPDEAIFMAATSMPFNADNTFPPLRSDVGSKFGLVWSDQAFGIESDSGIDDELKFEITGTELAGASLIGSGLDFGSLAGGGGRYNSKLIAVGHRAIYVEDI